MHIQPRNFPLRHQHRSQLQLCVPQVTFVEDAYRRAVSGTLGKLAEEDDGR
jgi:hypothetical protein